MTIKTFSHALRRGLGSAIIELQTNPNREQYKNIVLRCCLNDIAYDTQTEGSRGYYLYTAIKTFDDSKIFLDKMIEKFGKRPYWRLSEQLFNTLNCFANDGSEAAREALENKYDELKKRLPMMRNYNHGIYEREQLESLMIRKLDGGFKAFKQCVNDMGEMIVRRGNSDCLWHDWFLYNAKEKFGEKRVNDYIDEMSKKSDVVKALSDAIKAYKLLKEQHKFTESQEKVTVDMLVKVAKNSVSEEYPRGAIMRYRHMFMKNASETEILKLANAVLQEKDDDVKGLLLRCFWRRPFPLDITPLLQYVQSDNELLEEAAISTLEETKDKRIHDIAIKLLKEKGIKSLTFGLLKKNYIKSDDEVIFTAIKKSGNIPQHIQADINDIYTHHRSASAFPILLRVYQKGECSHCRYDTVRAMRHCGVLPDAIIEECLYDSYDETRKMAQRIKSRKDKDVKKCF